MRRAVCYTACMVLGPITKDVEVHMKSDPAKAIIEGKTGVPFQALVTLILQRKVFTLFKQWQNEPVIISSELLTGLASAPQDNHESRTHLLLITLGIGFLAGVAFLAGLMATLNWLDYGLGTGDLLLIAGCIVGGGVVLYFLSQWQNKSQTEAVTETLEKVANLLK